MVSAHLRATALQVLKSNDYGRYTQPFGWISPYQSNCNSALTALGWSIDNPDRAYTELESLVGMSDKQGMIAHISYEAVSGGLSHGPSTWGYLQSVDGRNISGLTHLPIAAIVLKLIYTRAPEPKRVLPLLFALHKWHKFLLTERNYNGGSEPVLVHPWESFRSYGSEWDEPLELVNNEEPLLALLETGRTLHWNQFHLAQGGKFRVLDTGFSACLAASLLDVAQLAGELGEDMLASESEMLAYAVAEDINNRVSEDGISRAFNCVTETTLDALSAGSALMTLLPSLSPAQIRTLRQITLEGELSSPYGVATLSANHPSSGHGLIWRGATSSAWTWLTALGFERLGENGAAAMLRKRFLQSAELGGMHEFNDASTGLGLGNDNSSATASLVLWELAR